MTVLKWVLVVVGVMFLAYVAVIAGGYYWASTIEAVRLDSADLKAGGAYSPQERQALLDVCHKRVTAPAGDKDACTCIADRAGSELSRFERLVLTAGFERSPSKIFALTKGLTAGGMTQSDADAMQKESVKRIDTVVQACGLVRKK